MAWWLHIEPWMVIGIHDIGSSIDCCLKASIHYLYLHWNLKNKLEWNLSQNAIISSHGNPFGNDVCKNLRIQCVNTLRPEENGQHFPDIFKCIFLYGKIWISMMAWQQTGDREYRDRSGYFCHAQCYCGCHLKNELPSIYKYLQYWHWNRLELNRDEN